MNMNARRIGAIISGPIIAIASVEAVGYPGVFAVCAVLTAIALVIVLIALPRSPASRLG
jgi:SET family sugar efflux transporter-like MFS transporter